MVCTYIKWQRFWHSLNAKQFLGHYYVRHRFTVLWCTVPQNRIFNCYLLLQNNAWFMQEGGVSVYFTILLYITSSISPSFIHYVYLFPSFLLFNSFYSRKKSFLLISFPPLSVFSQIPHSTGHLRYTNVFIHRSAYLIKAVRR